MYLVALERVTVVFPALPAHNGGLDFFRVTGEIGKLVVGLREEESCVLARGDARSTEVSLTLKL
jgi:hypothetical protein